MKPVVVLSACIHHRKYATELLARYAISQIEKSLTVFGERNMFHLLYDPRSRRLLTSKARIQLICFSTLKIFFRDISWSDVRTSVEGVEWYERRG